MPASASIFSVFFCQVMRNRPGRCIKPTRPVGLARVSLGFVFHGVPGLGSLSALGVQGQIEMSPFGGVTPAAPVIDNLGNPIAADIDWRAPAGGRRRGPSAAAGWSR